MNFHDPIFLLASRSKSPPYFELLWNSDIKHIMTSNCYYCVRMCRHPYVSIRLKLGSILVLIEWLFVRLGEISLFIL